MRKLLQVCLLLVAVASFARAQGGPPFITDDPGTPGNHHWEVNFGWIADHNPGNAFYETPDIDMNYGWGDQIQLKYAVADGGCDRPEQHHARRLGRVAARCEVEAVRAPPGGRAEVRREHGFFDWDLSAGLHQQPDQRRAPGNVENGPQYYLPMEFTAQLGPIAFDGEVGHWFGNQLIPSRWAAG